MVDIKGYLILTRVYTGQEVRMYSKRVGFVSNGKVLIIKVKLRN